MKRVCATAAVIFSSLLAVALFSCSNPSQPAELEDHIRFTLNGSVDYYYKAGPSGTPTSPSGGTVDLNGLPVAYKYGSINWVTASASDFSHSNTPAPAVSRIWLSFDEFSTGSFILGEGLDGVLWLNESTTIEDKTVSLTITRFEAVGGRIEGSFSGTVTDGSVVSTISNGQFSVTHVKEVSGS
jgi:hypothetical protein